MRHDVHISLCRLGHLPLGDPSRTHLFALAARQRRHLKFWRRRDAGQIDRILTKLHESKSLSDGLPMVEVMPPLAAADLTAMASIQQPQR